MDVQLLTRFFMWCTILNGGLLILWMTVYMLAPDLTYRTQSKWFAISREDFDVAYYSFLGLFKTFYIVFNAVPFIALLIVG